MPESESYWQDRTDHRVIVFGATGRIGTEMVKLLAGDLRCAEVRALTRDPNGPAATHLEYLGPKVTAFKFDLNDLQEACADATDAFIVAPVFDDMEAWHTAVATALTAAGVGHAVKVSVTGARSPDTDPPPGRLPSLHWAGEEALRRSGVQTTVIRPTIFMQHFEMGTGLYERGDDKFYLPTGDAGVAFLDCRDIAAMGKALLMDPHTEQHRGGTYELTGPAAITGADIARVLTALTGRRVAHVDGQVAFEEHCAALGKPDWAKNIYAEAAGGWFAKTETAAFEAVVGRRPNAFAVWSDDRELWFQPR